MNTITFEINDEKSTIGRILDNAERAQLTLLFTPDAASGSSEQIITELNRTGNRCLPVVVSPDSALPDWPHVGRLCSYVQGNLGMLEDFGRFDINIASDYTMDAFRDSRKLDSFMTKMLSGLQFVTGFCVRRIVTAPNIPVGMSAARAANALDIDVTACMASRFVNSESFTNRLSEAISYNAHLKADVKLYQDISSDHAISVGTMLGQGRAEEFFAFVGRTHSSIESKLEKSAMARDFYAEMTSVDLDGPRNGLKK